MITIEQVQNAVKHGWRVSFDGHWKTGEPFITVSRPITYANGVGGLFTSERPLLQADLAAMTDEVNYQLARQTNIEVDRYTAGRDYGD